MTTATTTTIFHICHILHKIPKIFNIKTSFYRKKNVSNELGKKKLKKEREEDSLNLTVVEKK